MTPGTIGHDPPVLRDRGRGWSCWASRGPRDVFFFVQGSSQKVSFCSSFCIRFPFSPYVIRASVSKDIFLLPFQSVSLFSPLNPVCGEPLS